MNNVMLANITWNPWRWKKIYKNPKAGHAYAQKYPGHESLNFKFNKSDIDDDKHIHGYFQWTKPPVNFEEDGLIIFFTRNTEINKGQIVGVYGKARIISLGKNYPCPGFKDDIYSPNIEGARRFSMLFPVPLMADGYKETAGKRMVPRIGFTYKNLAFAEKILADELQELSNSSEHQSEYGTLARIYEYYMGKKYQYSEEKEQDELVDHYRGKTKEELLAELRSLKPTDPEIVVIKGKTYKRDNKTIAQIKIIRGFKCQIPGCNWCLTKKDGRKYIEAAHIKPKHQKGAETLDNIMLLCPNHHKEFDLGKLEIIAHDKSSVEFVLNGARHAVSLKD